MWYGQIVNGKEFFSKVKFFNYDRPGCGQFFKSKTKKELLKKMDEWKRSAR